LLDSQCGIVNSWFNSATAAMPDQTNSWKIRVKKGNYEVEVAGPSAEIVQKMFEDLVKKYMTKLASSR